MPDPVAPPARRDDIASLLSLDGDVPQTVVDRAAGIASLVTNDVVGGRVVLESGMWLGRCQLLGSLGHGGQATVYRARQMHVNRLVAVKVPRRNVAERLLREAQLLAKLDHPHVVRVYDIEATGNPPYLVLELCPGGSLADAIAANPGGLPLERTKRIGGQILEALGAAHAAGIVHRDVKPQNVLFADDGSVRVCDFGIGTVALRDEVAGTLVSHTRAAGTPVFMAPEQEDPSLLDGARLDGRADLFAFGKLLYCMLTGRRPRGLRPPSAYREGLPAAWDELVLDLCEDRPAERVPDAATARRRLLALPAPALPVKELPQAIPWSKDVDPWSGSGRRDAALGLDGPAVPSNAQAKPADTSETSREELELLGAQHTAASRGRQIPTALPRGIGGGAWAAILIPFLLGSMVTTHYVFKEWPQKSHNRERRAVSFQVAAEREQRQAARAVELARTERWRDSRQQRLDVAVRDGERAVTEQQRMARRYWSLHRTGPLLYLVAALVAIYGVLLAVRGQRPAPRGRLTTLWLLGILGPLAGAISLYGWALGDQVPLLALPWLPVAFVALHAEASLRRERAVDPEAASA